MTEAWRTVFRRGIAPQLSTKGLEALRRALAEDSPQLLQGCTTSPPPLQCFQDWPVEGACAVTFCGWKGDGLLAVAAAEEYFAQVCYGCDQALEEPAACRWFLNAFDEEPRAEFFPKLLAEVDFELGRRGRLVPPSTSPREWLAPAGKGSPRP